MSASTTSIEGTERLGFSVPISEIDRKLNLMIPQDEHGKSSGVTRASLLNLALYSERIEYLSQNAEILETITRDSACRSLLICVDPSQSEASAQAWVQAHCQVDRKGRKSVCSEQISFVLNSGSPDLVRNTVFSHLDSDLPLIFWWRGEFSETFEDRLYSRIDRLVFDSETWGNPRNQLMRLKNAMDSGRGEFYIHDLAYTRMNAYRQAIASAFDMVSLRSEVGSLEEMKIHFPTNQRMSAVYLAAWLSDRLEAEFDAKRSSTNRYVFRSPHLKKESLAIELTETDDSDLAAALKVGSMILEVSRCPERDYLRSRLVSMNSEGEDSVANEDWLPIRKKTDAELITQILERGGRNRSLNRLIDFTGQLLTTD